MSLATYEAHRYVVPLREGGSLPAVLDTEGGLFVTKFRGAGQGARALIAELIVGGLAERLGLPIPEVALILLDDGFGRAEPDPEIQDILNGSRGLNVGLRYLDGAFGFDPLAVGDLVAPDLAAAIVWLDALTTNIDRTLRNPNLLWWGDDARLWLIDHGAALYFHHDWPSMTPERAQAPFVPIREHVLLPHASDLHVADARLAPLLTPEMIASVLDPIPAALLMYAPEGRTPPFAKAEANREAYRAVLTARLEAPRSWVADAEQARLALADRPTVPLAYRR
ncbi:MAG: aminotransferase class I and II [Rhodothermaceae bacterium]|nr:aminotransferase class I and II [Rhodothermaceae bacterium]